MLELKNISKTIGTQKILSDISLEVFENQLVSILGPSGSGKSTLLQIIGLLTDFQSGSISLENVDYNNLFESDRVFIRNKKLGFVFQFHNLLGEFTCEENIKFPLLIRGNKISADEENYFKFLCNKLGIENLVKKHPSQISGGEQQRIAVARALINRPSLLLADEPTGNLDNQNAENLYDLFVELKSELNQSIIMVTHNEKLTTKSDKIIFLESGQIK
ncbi:ABC transporter ATP-binding protein [Aquirufa sp. ROCK2-A2]